jgi:hypothetical protein
MCHPSLSWGRVFLCQSVRCPLLAHRAAAWCIVNKSSGKFPMFDELWSEINDSQGEIYDVIEYKEEWEKEEKFDVESYINGNTDY